MCGIAGYFGPNKIDNRALLSTSEIMRHRGPDGVGVFEHSLRRQHVGLVHRRLSIIDLNSRSNQPFKSGDYTLVFNGEIYNYLELKTELKKEGCSFVTSGDTEVLAWALRVWGPEAFQRLEGMWSVAWYNAANGTLMLSRDRFGEKPLHVWRYKGNVYFASEIPTLFELAGARPSVNYDHLKRYLVNGYKSLFKQNERFFKEIRQIPAGSFEIFSAEKQPIYHRYWNPSEFEENALSTEENIAIARENLIRSMELRVRSDVPLAFCMSGGVDSNSLISIARKELNCAVHGFTIVNTDERYEEQTIVDSVVKNLEIEHHSVELKRENFLNLLAEQIRARSEPVATISYFAHWILLKEISKAGFKVSMSGTGADELFTGYHDHHNLYLQSISSDLELLKSSLKDWEDYQGKIVRNPFLQDPTGFIKNPELRDHIYLNKDRFRAMLNEDWDEPFSENLFPGISLLKRRMLNELFYEVIPVILNEDDLNAMYASVENRSPFLDSTLYKSCYATPTKQLIQNGSAKFILREAMRNIVPDTVLDSRRKVGFNAPISDLLDHKNQQTRDFLLDDSPIFDLLDREKFSKILDMEDFTNSYSKFLFSFVNAKLFLEL